MSSIVGVVGIKVIVIVSRVTSRDKSVMEAVLVGTPAIVVMVIMTGMVVVTGVTGASPSMITVVVPAVVANIYPVYAFSLVFPPLALHFPNLL